MPKGDNFKGGKNGNNFALKGSKQPDPKAISEGKKNANLLISTLKQYKANAENTEYSETDANGNPISNHVQVLNALWEKAKKGDIKAAELYLKYTEATKTENRDVDEHGNDKNASILVQMIKRGVKLT